METKHKITADISKQNIKPQTPHTLSTWTSEYTRCIHNLTGHFTKYNTYFKQNSWGMPLTVLAFLQSNHTESRWHPRKWETTMSCGDKCPKLLEFTVYTQAKSDTLWSIRVTTLETARKLSTCVLRGIWWNKAEQQTLFISYYLLPTSVMVLGHHHFWVC